MWKKFTTSEKRQKCQILLSLNSHDHLVIIGANIDVRFHCTASAVAQLSVRREYDKEKKI